MIVLDNISKKFKKKIVVNNFSLEMGNFVYSLLGANGSGKTTLVRILSHVIEADRGNVLKFNEDNSEANSNEYKRLYYKNISVGYLPQKFGVFKEFTVIEQMKYFANLKKIPIIEQEQAILNVLDMVNLKDKNTDKCGTLSGGMVRRLGIAQAILGNPDIIIFDEPTTGLDPEERLRFKRIIYKIKGNCPILIATHIVEDVEAVSDKIIVLKDGNKITEDYVENIIAIATDKVFEIYVDQIDQLTSPHIVSRFFDDFGNKKKARVIFLGEIDENISNYPLVPTVEDGYLYIIHKV